MTPQHRTSHRIGLLVLLGVFSLLCMLFGTSASAQSVGPELAVSAAGYRLGAGDTVRIIVYQSPDLTLDARIGETGVVSYPLLGHVRIGGLSIGAAEGLIFDGLRNGNFVKSAQVSVFVTQVRGNPASVLGQVNRPRRPEGKQPLSLPAMDDVLRDGDVVYVRESLV
jgi:polysaccharide biosynthesis/export protein